MALSPAMTQTAFWLSDGAGIRRSFLEEWVRTDNCPLIRVMDCY